MVQHTDTQGPTNEHINEDGQHFYKKNLFSFNFLDIIFTRFKLKRQGSMNAIVEAFAFFLGFLGWLMVGIALPNRYWKVSTVDGNVITTSTIYENLWMSCATDSTGVHNCRDFPSLLALNGTWQTTTLTINPHWPLRDVWLLLVVLMTTYSEVMGRFADRHIQAVV